MRACYIFYYHSFADTIVLFRPYLFLAIDQCMYIFFSLAAALHVVSVVINKNVVSDTVKFS